MPLSKKFVVARPSIVVQKFNFVVGSKYSSPKGFFDWTEQVKNLLAPGQDNRQGVAEPPNAFPLMFLLSRPQGARELSWRRQTLLTDRPHRFE
jgi:hypothetical protein